MAFETRARGIAARQNMQEQAGDIGQLNRISPATALQHQPGSWQAERMRNIADKNNLGLVTGQLLRQSDAMDMNRANQAFSQNLANRQFDFNTGMAQKNYIRQIAQDAINNRRIGHSMDMDRQRFGLSQQQHALNMQNSMANQDYRNRALSNNEDQANWQRGVDRRNTILGLYQKFNPEDVNAIVNDPVAFDNLMSGYAPTRGLTQQDVMTGGQQQPLGPITQDQQQRALGGMQLRPITGSGGGSRQQQDYMKKLQLLGNVAAQSGIPENQLYDENGRPSNALMGFAQALNEGVPMNQALQMSRMKTQEQIDAEQNQADMALAKGSRWYWPDPENVDAAQERIKQFEQKYPQRALEMSQKQAQESEPSSPKYKPEALNPNDVVMGILNPSDQADYKAGVNAFNNMIENPKENADRIAATVEGIHNAKFGRNLKFHEIFSPYGAGTEYWADKAAKILAKDIGLPESMDKKYVVKYYEDNNGAGSFDRFVNNYLFNYKNSGIMPSLKAFRKEFGNRQSSPVIEKLRGSVIERNQSGGSNNG